MTNGGAVGVALAGGRSRRMGADKAQIPWQHTTLLGWTVERLHRVTGSTVLIAGPSRDSAAGSSAPSRTVEDAAARGPLAGLLGAAAAAPDRDLLVLACDLPLVTEQSLQGLLRTAAGSDADAVVAWGPDRWQPLCAVYRPAALATLLERARHGDHALYRALRERAVRCERFLGSTEEPPESWHRQLFNVNTPEDLESVRLRS